MNFNTTNKIAGIGLILAAASLAFGQSQARRAAATSDPLVTAQPNPPSIALLESGQQFPTTTPATVATADDYLVAAGTQPPRAVVEHWVGDSSGGDRALIVRSTETDPKTLAAMEEDLNIMGRILEKSVRETESSQHAEAMGLPLVTIGGNSRSTQIEGYGVLFQLNVAFPLRGTEEKSEENSAKSTPDSPWEQTRRELQGRTTDPLPGGLEPAVQAKRNSYDPKRVDRLKNSVLEALKNASNMSQVKSDDSITVLVKSSARSFLTVARAKPAEVPAAKAQPDSADPYTSRRVSAFKTAWAGNASGAVLSIRVKKSDIDAFAAGKLSPDEFRKKAAILVY